MSSSPRPLSCQASLFEYLTSPAALARDCLLEPYGHFHSLLATLHDAASCSLLLGRLAYINWLWYAWGSLMINQFQDTTATAFGNQPVLQYYNLEGKSAWAFMGYEAIFFVVFFFLAWFGLLVVKWQRR